MDRIDIEVMVHSVETDERLTRRKKEGSISIRKRVEAARQLQIQRYEGTGITCNAFVPGGKEREYCEMSPTAEALFEKLIRTMGTKLSIRRECKLLKVARTIADLDDQRKIGEKHIVQAASLIGRDLGGIIRNLAPELYSSAAIRSSDDDIAKGIRDLKKALD
jgi:magnesium chelatase family protein